MPRLRRRALVAASAGLLLAPRVGAQERFPSRELVLVVPFAAGGGTDLAGRAFAEALRAVLGQPIAVQNLPGAGSATGLTRLADQKGDGYTIGMMGGFMVTTSLRGQLKVPLATYTPLARLSQETFVLAVPSASPHRTAADYLAAARRAAGAVSIGTAGSGALTHLAAAALAQAAKADLNIVHFDGGARLVPAVLGGHVDSGVFSQVEVLAHAGAGGFMRVLASFGAARSAKYPDAPTLGELGLSGVPAGPWQGLVAPKGVPDDVKATLVAAITRAAADPGWASYLDRSGLTAFLATGPALEAFLKEEIDTTRALLGRIGLLP